MPLRFIDTEFFKHPFVRGLKSPYKLLYTFILCDCDNAGIWSPEFEVAAIYTDQKQDRETAMKIFKGKFVELSNGKWFFPDFIQWQYPTGLSEKNPAHTKIINTLKRFDLIDSELKPKPIQATPRGEQGVPPGGTKVKVEGKVGVEDGEEGKVGAPPKLKVVSTHTLCKDFYVNYQEKNNRECNWSGKYAGSLAHILGKLKITYTKSNGREPTETDLYNSFEYLIRNLPEWHQDKDLSVINSNYDSIVNQLKSGKSTATTPRRNSADFHAQRNADQLAKLFGDTPGNKATG